MIRRFFRWLIGEPTQIHLHVSGDMLSVACPTITTLTMYGGSMTSNGTPKVDQCVVGAPYDQELPEYD